ncbi:MAG: hypothetical protein V3S43_06230 [Acidimicrobiia bacterium]
MARTVEERDYLPTAESEAARKDDPGMRDTNVMAPKQRTYHTAGRNTIHDAEMHDVAFLVCQGLKTNKQIAAQADMSVAKLEKMFLDDRFQIIYQRVHREVIGTVTEIVANEKADPILRDKAMSTRGRTLLAEVQEKLRERIKGDDAKGDIFRSAVAAAKISIDLEKRVASGKSPTNVQINVFNPSKSQATAIQDAYAEAGLNMTDVLEGCVSVVEKEKDHNGEKSEETASVAPGSDVGAAKVDPDTQDPGATAGATASDGAATAS